MKIATPLEKSHPLSPSNPPLKVEVLSSTHFLKIWLEAQPPPPPLQKEEGVPTMVQYLEAQHFYLKFWYYWILCNISVWLKKLNGFLMGKNSIFQNNKVKNFKNPEILRSKGDFLQAINFDTFRLANWNFLNMFYTKNPIGNYRIKKS